MKYILAWRLHNNKRNRGSGFEFAKDLGEAMIESNETLLRCREVVRDVANDCRMRAAVTSTPALANNWSERATLLQKVDTLLKKIVEVQNSGANLHA
jgi:hypothetical protein